MSQWSFPRSQARKWEDSRADLNPDPGLALVSIPDLQNLQLHAGAISPPRPAPPRPGRGPGTCRPSRLGPSLRARAGRRLPPCPQPTSGPRERRGAGWDRRTDPTTLGRVPTTARSARVRPGPPRCNPHVLSLVYRPEPRPRPPLAAPGPPPLLPPSPAGLGCGST